MIERNKIFQHDVQATPWPLPDNSVDVVITSPPYWGLRDYLNPSQIGQELSPENYVERLVKVFREAWRVLKPTGTFWLNLADTYWGGKGQSGATWDDSGYNGGRRGTQKGETRPQDRRHSMIKPKDLVGIPWTVALALRNAGWYLRQDIIWNKPNPMPESVTDRCTKAHEYIFMLTKSRDYYFDQDAILQDAKPASDARTSQDVASQTGSDRVPGKVNGSMKAIRRSGNLERKDATERGAPSTGVDGNVPWEGSFANKKSVWTVPTRGFDGEFCTACRRYYAGKEKRLIKIEHVPRPNGSGTDKIKRCLCGRHDAWVAHFATFPEDLIVDCVKASTSHKGNCASCGSPWERITEPVIQVDHTGTTDSNYDEKSTAGRLAKLRQAAREQGQEYTSARKTLGWQPTCSCNDDNVVKPIVLDMFMGGGTTGLVSLAQGRDFVGLELNPDYIDLAEHRLRHQFGVFFQL